MAGLAGRESTLARDLAGGWRQRLALGCAILHEPAILFLDEPTGGVDPITRRQFWELIYATAAQGTTVFVTTHYMDEAEYCDRVSIMVDGRIAALGTPAELKAKFQSETIDDVFVRIARPGAAA
jgi:ABC-2 type transport system ATP-binding protein